MKTVNLALMGAALFVCCIMVSRCGSSSTAGACSGSTISGTYTGTILGNADTMVIADSCTVTSSYCGSTGTVPKVTSASGTLLVTVASTAGKSGCLAAGETTCAYSLASNVLTYTCGGGTVSYTKQ